MGKKQISACICGVSTMNLDRYWVKAGYIAVALILGGSLAASYIEKSIDITQRIWSIIALIYLMSFGFYKFKRHTLICSARQAALMLARLGSASPTHQV